MRLLASLAMLAICTGAQAQPITQVVDGGGRIIHRGDPATFKICNNDQGIVGINVTIWALKDSSGPPGTKFTLEYGECGFATGKMIGLWATPRTRKVKATWIRYYDEVGFGSDNMTP